MYDLHTMKELLRLATELGYQEEIDHWKSEIAKAEEGL